MVLLSALLAGLCVLVLRRREDGRIGRLLPRPRPASGGRAWPATPALACGLGGAAFALLVAGPAGVALGLALAAAGPRLLGLLEPVRDRAERAQLAADLPLLLDLLSSCLAGGAALPEAARAVAAAVPGPAGSRLASVVAQLAVGTAPSQAWQALTGGGGGDAHAGEGAGARASPAGRGAGRGASEARSFWSSQFPARECALEDDPLAPAARALGRAAEGGAPVAAAVARLAADARARSRAQGELAARRVGVLVVAPLGLCFLPAFVLLGVVPVVAGLVGPLLATF